MAERTKIEWTHRPGTTPATLNALVGCQKISAGCQNCYAIEVSHVRGGNQLPVMQEKFGGVTRSDRGKRVWTGKVSYSERTLLSALHKTKPHTYFVNSLSDLFYTGVLPEWIDSHFALFALTSALAYRHTHLVLTKRANAMYEYLSDPKTRQRVLDATAKMAADHWPMNYALPGWLKWVNSPRCNPRWRSAGVDTATDAFPWPLPNVWLGVSAEDQAAANLRVPFLLQTPAAIRFVSAEPLLGPIDFENIAVVDGEAIEDGEKVYDGFRYNALTGEAWADDAGDLTGECGIDAKLDWIICGGESGREARAMNAGWARSMLEDCRANGVAFFMKQMGSMFGPKKGSEIPADLLVREWPQVKSEDDASQSHPSQSAEMSPVEG